MFIGPEGHEFPGAGRQGIDAKYEEVHFRIRQAEAASGGLWAAAEASIPPALRHSPLPSSPYSPGAAAGFDRDLKTAPRITATNPPMARAPAE